MAKKKKIVAKKTAPVKPSAAKATQGMFLGLTPSQTQSLAVGIIVAGFGLFVLAGYVYKNKADLERTLPSQLSANEINGVTDQTNTEETSETKEDENKENTNLSTPSITPIKMISATSTAAMVEKPANNQNAPVKQLPNTSSKVTYTVEEGDNIAKIGVKLCADDRAYLSIIETNTLYPPYTVHAGETLIITCN